MSPPTDEFEQFLTLVLVMNEKAADGSSSRIQILGGKGFGGMCLSVCLAVCLSICLSGCLFVCVSLSICRSLSLSLSLSLSQSNAHAPQTQTYLVRAPGSEVDSPVVQPQFHVADCVGEIPAHDAALLVSSLRDSFHVKQLAGIVLNSGKTNQGDRVTLIRDHLRGREI